MYSIAGVGQGSLHMKTIFSIFFFLFCVNSLALECSNMLEQTLRKKLKNEQSLVQVIFKKILAPREKYQDYWGSRKIVINREKYPVYYFRSVIEEQRNCERSSCPSQYFHHAYLLSPNSCAILKNALLFVH